MNQKTKTALYSLATCACIISAATAVILTINAKNRKPEPQVTVIEEPAEEEEQPRAERPRRRGNRNRGGGGGFRDDHRRGDMTHLLPDEDDLANLPTPEEFEEEVIKGLEEYRALTPEQKFEQVRQMHQVTLFVQSAIEMFRDMLLLLSGFCRVRLCVTQWTAAHQAPSSLGFSRPDHHLCLQSTVL